MRLELFFDFAFLMQSFLFSALKADDYFLYVFECGMQNIQNDLIVFGNSF
jgi:hypothetical protein